MNTLHKDGSVMGHRFERAGYKPPFRYMGYSNETYEAMPGMIQAGTSCCYCGTSISNVFHLMDAEGRKFWVGSDCIGHTGDKKLVVLVESEVRKQNAIKRHNREQAKKAELLPAYELALVKLEALPHPNAYFSGQGKTYADYVRFCSVNSTSMRQAIARAQSI